MITETESPAEATASILPQEPLAESVTIQVSITSPTDPANVGLQIAADQRYLRVAENFDDTITWELNTSNAPGAFFDNPGIVFQNSPGPLEIHRTPDGKQLSVFWSNVNPATRGQSFSYRLYVVVPIGGNLIPVVHDPTVHNEPPTN